MLDNVQTTSRAKFFWSMFNETLSEVWIYYLHFVTFLWLTHLSLLVLHTIACSNYKDSDISNNDDGHQCWWSMIMYIDLNSNNEHQCWCWCLELTMLMIVGANIDVNGGLQCWCRCQTSILLASSDINIVSMVYIYLFDNIGCQHYWWVQVMNDFISVIQQRSKWFFK